MHERLKLSIVLNNSNTDLLMMVEQILLSHFRIHTVTYLSKKKGSTWKCYGKTVFSEKGCISVADTTET